MVGRVFETFFIKCIVPCSGPQFSEGLTSTTISLAFDKSRSFCSSGRKSLSKLPIDAALALKKEEEAEGERLTAGPLLLWNQGLPPSGAETGLQGFVSLPGLSPSRTLSLAGFYPLCPQVPPSHLPAPHFPFHKALVSRHPMEKVSFEWYSGLGKPMNPWWVLKTHSPKPKPMSSFMGPLAQRLFLLTVYQHRPETLL